MGVEGLNGKFCHLGDNANTAPLCHMDIIKEG